MGLFVLTEIIDYAHPDSERNPYFAVHKSVFGQTKTVFLLEESMLQIKNITITHHKDLRTIAENFSFSLGDQDKAVIIGEEGNGKSTLLKLIVDPALIEDYADYEGEIINTMKTGYLAQELNAEQKQMTIYEFCMEASGFFEKTPRELADIARMLGLEADLFYSDQIVGTLSGGEKVKLQMARIMMESPDVLLLDEPSNDIDIETLEWLENFINRCGLPVLFISHDEMLIENTANVIIHLEQLQGKVRARLHVARMPYRQYAEDRLYNIQRQDQMARNDRKEFDKQMEKYRQIQQKVEHAQNAVSRQDPSTGRLLKKKMKSVMAMGRRFEKKEEQLTQRPVYELPITVSFPEHITLPAGKTILDLEMPELRIEERVLAENIKLHIEGPEKICIIGRNGSGKTTLLKEIAKQLLERKDIKAAYMPQDYEECLDPEMTPVEFLTRTGTKEENTKIRTFLGSMRYTRDEMYHRIREMSGGQKAKLLFMKMILDENDVLILDEPTRNFSPLSGPEIRKALMDYGGAIISISHDRKYIQEVCDSVYAFTKDGLMKL